MSLAIHHKNSLISNLFTKVVEKNLSENDFKKMSGYSQLSLKRIQNHLISDKGFPIKKAALQMQTSTLPSSE